MQTGYGMLWVLLAATFVTIILQEMSARLGWATQSGLGEAIRTQFDGGWRRALVFSLVIGAILVGNAAYQAGNLAGGVLGMELLMGAWNGWTLVAGALCFALLYFGKYRWVERILIALVLLMSVCFLLTAVLARPDWSAILAGFVPRLPASGNWMLVLTLLGTTVVPYNLFLHASTISKKYDRNTSLRDIRTENTTSILLGGIISMLLIITAGNVQSEVDTIRNAADLAIPLRPLFGNTADWLMGLGLTAAGISSALTAPLAAAYAARGLFGWSRDESDPKFRAVWMTVLGIGMLVGLLGLQPVPVILFAQITNAILLPLVAAYLLYLVNSKKLMGKHRNGWLSNALGILIIGSAVLLALRLWK